MGKQVAYEVRIGQAAAISIEIPALASLTKHRAWLDQAVPTRNGQLRRLNLDIPAEPGIYFLFYADGRLLYVGKASNIRQRLNQHTATRTVHQIALQERRNPRHIQYVSWVVCHDEGARDVLETAYLRSYGTAWNVGKVDMLLDYPEAPDDEDLQLPEVQQYLRKTRAIIDRAILSM